MIIFLGKKYELSAPKLEGLMLQLKLQYFAHLSEDLTH